MVLSGILQTIGSVISTITGVIRTILSFAPGPVKILIFLVVGLGLFGLIGDYLLAPTYVCTEDNFYKASNIGWGLAAKGQPIAEDVSFELTDEQKKRFQINEELGAVIPTISALDEPIDPNVESPGLQSILIATNQQLGITEYGTLLARNSQVITKLEGEEVGSESLLLAVPHKFDDNRSITQFFTFWESLSSDGLTEVFSDTKSVVLNVCRQKSEFKKDNNPLFNLPAWLTFFDTQGTNSELAGEGGTIRPNTCYMTTRTTVFNTCPGGSDVETIARIIYLAEKLDPSDSEDLISTNPGLVPNLEESERVNRNNQYSFSAGIYNTGDSTLNDCPQIPGSNQILLAVPETPINLVAKSLAIDLGVITVGFTDEGVKEQSGYVFAKYISLDRQGVDFIKKSLGEEAEQFRDEWVRNNLDHFTQITEKGFDGEIVGYRCGDERNTEITVFGIPIFSTEVFVIFLFFLGIISFLYKFVF